MGEFYGVPRESTRETPTMLSVIRICRKCGAKIFSDAPEAVCARCVLKSALGGLVGVSVAEVDLSAGASAKAKDPGHVDKPMRAATKSTSAAELLGELGDYDLQEV